MISQDVLEAMKERKPVQYNYRNDWRNFDYNESCSWYIFLDYEWRVKPKKVKAWQWIIKNRNGEYSITLSLYTTKEKAQKEYSYSEVIDPFLPSEREAEV